MEGPTERQWLRMAPGNSIAVHASGMRQMCIGSVTTPEWRSFLRESGDGTPIVAIVRLKSFA